MQNKMNSHYRYDFNNKHQNDDNRGDLWVEINRDAKEGKRKGLEP